MKVLKYITISLFIVVISLFAYMKITQKNMSEMALDIFTWVKTAGGNSVKIEDMKTTTSISVDHTKWTNLLEKHLSSEGQVNYQGFINDKELLNEYLDDISKNPPSDKISKNEKLAYWINAYNAFTVKLIIDHYPLKSIKDISSGLPMINSPWDIKFFKIGGVDFDLNTIEHQILRKQFDEPRIHFAINCASFSCPKLRNEAFEAQKLESQLHDQAEGFINNIDKNLITESEVKLSNIFNWFAGDFTKSKTLSKYISQYSNKFNPDFDIEYLDYDWSLND